MKLDILAVGVHPDDVELSSSGTLLSHIAKGKKVGLLDLTKGELGTRGSAQIRTLEAMAAAKIMGVVVREQLDMADGFFVYSDTNIRQIIQKIRKYRPEIVLCNAPSDRHPDHGRASKLTADSCFYSGLLKIETFDENGGLQEKWRPKAVYHYIQDNHLEPDFVFDITPFFEKKIESVMAYKSQFYDPTNTEPATPISGKDFIDALTGKAGVFGREIGAKYAEGFIAARQFGVKDLFDLI
jgi:N-acetylglucosamine malate deacetylase 1